MNRNRMDRLARIIHSEMLCTFRKFQRMRLDPKDPNYNPNGQTLWKQRTVLDAYEMALVKGTMDAERARQTAEAPKLAGVVVVPMRIDSKQEWEAVAAAPAPRLAIDATIAEKPEGGK